MDRKVLRKPPQVICKTVGCKCKKTTDTANEQVTKTKKKTILTGDKRYRNEIIEGEHLNRHADRPYVFYFFSHRTFLKTILATHTLHTFGFACQHTSQPEDKAKRVQSSTLCSRDEFLNLTTIISLLR